jgi:hypothetical protein
MKITKSHLAKLIKEEMSKISEMRYAENKETGRWEEVVDGAEPQAPRRGSARGVPGGISDLDIMVQDSLSAIADDYNMPLDAIRDTLNRMIEDAV